MKKGRAPRKKRLGLTSGLERVGSDCKFHADNIALEEKEYV